MPAKGGNTDLTDDEVKRAVAFMAKAVAGRLDCSCGDGDRYPGTGSCNSVDGCCGDATGRSDALVAAAAPGRRRCHAKPRPPHQHPVLPTARKRMEATLYRLPRRRYCRLRRNSATKAAWAPRIGLQIGMDAHLHMQHSMAARASAAKGRQQPLAGLPM